MNSDRKRSLFSFFPGDWVVMAYCALVMTLIVFTRQRIPDWMFYFCGHGAIVATTCLLAAWEPRSKSRFIRFLRDFDLIAYVIAVFLMTTVLVHRVHPVDYDLQLIAIDRKIGGISVLKYMESISNPVMTDVSKILWVVYYSMPVIVGAPIYFKMSRHKLQEGKMLYALTFLTCYAGYFAVPAEGPGYYQEETGVAQPKWEESAVSQEIKQGIDVMEGRARDTFPSGHVMAVTMAIVFCFKYRIWKTSIFVIPVSLGIIGSTLYLRYHYLIDGLTGLVLVGLITFFGSMWYRRFEKGNPELV